MLKDIHFNCGLHNHNYQNSDPWNCHSQQSQQDHSCHTQSGVML